MSAVARRWRGDQLTSKRRRGMMKRKGEPGLTRGMEGEREEEEPIVQERADGGVEFKSCERVTLIVLYMSIRHPADKRC